MKFTMKKPVNIPVNKLKPFDENPYKVQDNDEMNSLITSIQDIGITEPILVRPIENTDEYEVISGHRRLHAAEKAGLETVPALIYAISRDEAAVMLVDSNLHREHILPSEKAFAYKLKMEALNSRGCRSDLTLSQVATKLDSAAEIGKESGESRDTVFRYIRLTYLIPQLLDLMDENRIAFSVGVELSYLDDQSQFDVLEQCEQNDCTPSYSQAVRMHKAINDGTLDKDFIIEIMSEEKANQRETYRIPAERLRGKIPSFYTAQQREYYIVKAVEYYQKFLERQKDRGR